jgi:protein O-GlcNAc transferase
MLGRLLSGVFRRGAARAAGGASARELEQATRLLQLGDGAGAVLLCERVLARDPGTVKAWELLGVAALNAGDYALASERFEQVLALAGEDAQALANAAEANRRADRGDRALELIRRALVLRPDSASYLHIQVLCLESCWRSDEALRACRDALRLHPDFAKLHTAYLSLLNRAGADPALVLEAHCDWADRFAGVQASDARHGNAPQPERRLRIGYVSADFRAHAVSDFILPLLQRHDPAGFDVHCYSNSPKTDHITRRCEALAPQWRDIVALKDEAVAELIRSDGIDILIDLSGHTVGNRLGLFARKPAPLQITYLGYPATTGLVQMDYRITDACADPGAAGGSLYREQLLRLPHSLWCFAPPEGIPEVGPLPAAAAGHVTLGSLNSAYKLTPQFLALWAQLLKSLPGSRLVFAGVPGGTLRARIAREFSSNGVDPDRLEFHGFLPWEEFWALHARIDIALDTFPCNGGTTTCESLWLGVPVVNLMGRPFLSRAGLSLLSAIGLRELVAQSAEDYLHIARALALDPERLARLRSGMRERMRASPLLDAVGFTRDLEGLYRAAWRQWCAHQPAARGG